MNPIIFGQISDLKNKLDKDTRWHKHHARPVLAACFSWQPVRLHIHQHLKMKHGNSWSSPFHVVKLYCWWLKSCTTWDVKKPVKNGKNYLSTGAGFQPSTVSHHLCRFWWNWSSSPSCFSSNATTFTPTAPCFSGKWDVKYPTTTPGICRCLGGGGGGFFWVQRELSLNYSYDICKTWRKAHQPIGQQ